MIASAIPILATPAAAGSHTPVGEICSDYSHAGVHNNPWVNIWNPDYNWLDYEIRVPAGTAMTWTAYARGLTNNYGGTNAQIVAVDGGGTPRYGSQTMLFGTSWTAFSGSWTNTTGSDLVGTLQLGGRFNAYQYVLTVKVAGAPSANCQLLSLSDEF